MMFGAATVESGKDMCRATFALFAVSIALLICGIEFVSISRAEAASAVKYKEKIVYSFCSAQDCADGSDPDAVLLYRNGKLYGTTIKGGLGCQTFGCGTVFSVDLDKQTETVLYSFCSQENCSDGATPLSGLISWKGALFGSTTMGGAQNCSDGCGTVFRLDPKTGAEKVLYAFCKINCDDGQDPLAGVIEAGGLLYGTTQGGGAGEGLGTAYVLDPQSGAETVLHSFCSEQNCSDGQNPNASLIYLNGKLYGTTTAGGGGCKCGTVFSLDPNNGAEIVLHDFGSGDGRYPTASLIAVNGLLYGTTDGGGVGGCGGFGCGTVFSLDPITGAEKVVYAFCSRKNCTDGANPVSGLLGVNGTLYGTTLNGGGPSCGGPGCGTVFSIDPHTDKEIVLYAFGGGADGGDPGGSLIENKGTLYGTTSIGGNQGCGGSGCGTVFALYRKH